MVFFQYALALPCLVALSSILAYHVFQLVHEFEPVLSDTLTPNEVESLYIITTPPAYTGDIDAQMAPMDLLLQQLETVPAFADATLAAAEMFVDNVTTMSVASPVECSLQLYKADVEPTPDDMWTARGVLVKTGSSATSSATALDATRQLTQELQQRLPRNLRLKTAQFGPGPFVKANHSMVQWQGNFFFALLVTNWVEDLIAFHQQTFDFQEEFVVSRIMVMAKNPMDEITYTEHVIMKPDSLDLYQQLHPNHRKDKDANENPQSSY